MMFSKKNKILLALTVNLLLSCYSFAQDEFNYNQEGLTPKFSVTKVESLKQKELFDKTINWISETYKNPAKVIKAKIGNEKIRIVGFFSKMFSYKSVFVEHFVDAYYTIEISFKDGKYKFEPIEITSTFKASGCYEPGDHFIINLADGSEYYKSNGKLRCKNNLPQSLSKMLNSLNRSLNNYLTQTPDSNDDW